MVRNSCLSRVPFSVSPILGDRSPVMLNRFIVMSVLKMEVFCCYERAFGSDFQPRILYQIANSQDVSHGIDSSKKL